MFGFFEKNRHSSLESTSTLDGADTSSSMESHYRDYSNDDESSLGSCSKVDAEVEEDVIQAIETALSKADDAEYGRESQQIPLKDLHRLVGIASAEERVVEEHKPDLPSYKIR